MATHYLFLWELTPSIFPQGFPFMGFFPPLCKLLGGYFAFSMACGLREQVPLFPSKPIRLKVLGF